MDFQSEKSFGKLRLRALQPYHQILCILKHVKDVEDIWTVPQCEYEVIIIYDLEKIPSTLSRNGASVDVCALWIFQ